MIKRSSLPKRTKPPRKVNAKRRKSEFARTYGSKERVEWVKSLRCIVYHIRCSRPSENAHVETGGTGRKANADKVVPLCEQHHWVLHRTGRESFEASFDIDLTKAAAETQAKWAVHVAESEQ